MGLAISPVSLLFCNYLVCIHKYVVELSKEIEKKNIKTKIANAKIAKLIQNSIAAGKTAKLA